MYGTLVLSLIIGIAIIFLCVFAINKAYSRKWDEPEE
ncbi:hypothetical protein MALU111345_20115 [Marinicrinis lubricantis]